MSRQPPNHHVACHQRLGKLSISPQPTALVTDLSISAFLPRLLLTFEFAYKPARPPPFSSSALDCYRLEHLQCYAEADPISSTGKLEYK